MKLLFDENLSPRLVPLLTTAFPGSVHVEEANLRGATDQAIWDFAKVSDLMIVSKDNDFRQRSFVHGHPPKVVWLSVGNAGTSRIESLLKERRQDIEAFYSSTEESLLVIEDHQV